MKINRNDYCPCGSGRKYKNCCMNKPDTAAPSNAMPLPRRPADDLNDMNSARADVMSPEYWEKMSKRLPRDMRKEFGSMIAQAKQYAETESRWERIEAAAQALEAHRAEYAKFTEDTSKLLRRAEELFAEAPFEAMLFHANDVQRAFEAVGYPPSNLIDGRFAEIMDKAVRFLLDDKQRESLAYRLLLTLPDYVAAGRHLDGWIIQHSADLTVKMPEGVVGPFLMAIFMHGFREWEEAREREQMAMFNQLGIDPDEIRRMGYDGLDAWMREMSSKPDKAEVLERFLAKHPELNAMTQAQCHAAEDAALKLLQREDTQGLLLSPEEVEPWLEVLEQRFRAAPEVFASISHARSPDEKVAKTFANLLYDVAAEMASAIFTPARLDRMKSQLHEMRRRFSGEDDHEALAGVNGAFMAAQNTAPGDSRFLVSVCWISLRETMNIMAQTSMGDQT